MESDAATSALKLVLTGSRATPRTATCGRVLANFQSGSPQPSFTLGTYDGSRLQKGDFLENK